MKDQVKLCPKCSQPMDVIVSTLCGKQGLVSITHGCRTKDCNYSETQQFQDESNADEALWCWWQMRE